jgi:hypothetical protein
MKRTTLAIGLALLFAPELAEAKDTGKWEYVGTDQNVVVYRKNVEGSDVVAFKGVTYADLPIGKVLAVFKDPDERKNWVDRYKEHVTLEKGEDTETYWIHFGLPWPVSDRDYILNATGRRDLTKKTFYVNIKSVQHPKKGEDDCCVRAIVNGTYYEFTALPGEDKTKITVEVHTDPKGSLPTWLVNLIQKSWPAKTLGGLIKRAKDPSIKALPDFADWHLATKTSTVSQN